MSKRLILHALASAAMTVLLIVLAHGCGAKTEAPEVPAPVSTEAPAPVATSTPEPAPEPEPESAPAPAAKSNRPNVVFIILDTLRADGLGIYGSKVKSSPALDAYAEQGVIFDTVLTQCTWTRPSIGSTLTGLYPRTLGLFIERDQILNDRFTTLAEIMKEEGYATFGLTANPNINSTYNFQQGFDQYFDSNVLFPWMDRKQGPRRSLHSANEMFEQASQMIDELPDEQAVYLQINLMEAHEWYQRAPNLKMLRPEYEKLFGRGRWVAYKQSIKQMTDDTAAFMVELMKRPGWEDTLFVFTSDHGEGLGDHPGVNPSKHHGKLMYESQAIVPWFMYRAGWQPKTQRVMQEVRLLEVLPTLLDYLDIEAPDGIDGVSMLPVINGEAESVALPERFVLESYFKGADMRAVYGPDYKYIYNGTPHRGLDDHELQKRGGEENGGLTNLAGEFPEIMQTKQDYLKEWEAAHPKSPHTPMQGGLTKEMEDQLKAIGYL